jgi:hypothetical protein
LAGGLDKYRVVVETLAEEFDIMDIAAGGGPARPSGRGW